MAMDYNDRYMMFRAWIIEKRRKSGKASEEEIRWVEGCRDEIKQAIAKYEREHSHDIV